MIFLTVAKHLSYTRAAKELYMSQPAVSKNIQELEQELGARLFNRKGNSIALTSAGKVVFSYGTDIDRLTQNLRHDLGTMADKLAGCVNIGASTTISQYVIPSAIARFKVAHPAVDVSLISGNTSEINTRLENDTIDLGITEGGRRLNSFNYTSFLDDEVAFISGASHLIPEPLTIEKLRNLPLIIREAGSGTREVFEDVLQEIGVKLSDLNILITLGSTESIKSFLLNTQAVGVFSVNAIRSSEESLFQVCRLKDSPINRTFSFITKQGAEHKMTTKFIRFTKRHYNLLE